MVRMVVVRMVRMVVVRVVPMRVVPMRGVGMVRVRVVRVTKAVAITGISLPATVGVRSSLDKCQVAIGENIKPVVSDDTRRATGGAALPVNVRLLSIPTSAAGLKVAIVSDKEMGVSGALEVSASVRELGLPDVLLITTAVSECEEYVGIRPMFDGLIELELLPLSERSATDRA